MTSDLTQLVSLPDTPLTFRVRKPSSGRVKGSPCLLLLHGVGANEIGFISVAEQIDPKFTVILVRSPIQFGPMQFGFFQVSFTSSGPKINAKQAEESRQLLIRLIEDLPSLFNVDAKKIWIAGFSQGGILSSSVALSRPDLVRGFGLLSGRILPEISPIIAEAKDLQNLEVYISHGTNDDVLSVDFARSAKKFISDKVMQLEYREFNAGHELNAEMKNMFFDWLSQRP